MNSVNKKSAVVIFNDSYLNIKNKYINKIITKFINFRLKAVSNHYIVHVLREECPKADRYGLKDYCIIENVETPENRDMLTTIEQSIDAIKGWYNYADFPEHLDVGGANLGEVVRTRLSNKNFDILNNINKCEFIINSVKPEVVISITNADIIGKVVNVVCKNNEIQNEVLFRIGLKKLLNKILQKKNSAWWKQFHDFEVFISNNHFENSPNLLIDVPYVNYFKCVEPIIKKINADKSFNLIILTKKNIINDLELIDFIPHEVNIKQKINRNKYLKKYFYNVINDDNFKHIFTYHNYNYWELIKPDISHIITSDYIFYCNDINKYINIIEEFKPIATIIGSESRGDMVCGHAIICKNRNLPIFEVQHGHFTMSPVLFDPLSDIIFVGGNFYKNILNKCNVSSEKIVVSGWPKYDSLYKNSIQRTDDDGAIKILFVTQPIDTRFNLDIITTIITDINKHENLRLIVKPHPMEDDDIYSKQKNLSEQVIIESKNDNIFNYLVEADVILLISSTVGIEAAILGKPIVSLNFFDNEDRFIEEGIAIKINSPAEILPCVEKIINDDYSRTVFEINREKFLINYAVRDNIDSSEIILKTIQKYFECGQFKW